MKIRISATIEPEIEERISKIVEKRGYRNKSHFIEKALENFLEKEEKGANKSGK